MAEQFPDHPGHTSLSGDPVFIPPGRQPGGTSSLTVDLRKPPLASAGARPDLLAAADEPAFPGERPLLGEYELLSEVGRGGMGIVYKARHRGLGRVVALKVTREDPLIFQEEAKRFQAEAAVVARLDHPHIVPVYEVGEAYDRLYFSMAFVEGQSLADAVAHCPLPPGRAARLMQTIASAIAYAHSQGVIHRDLKPDNILLDTSGRPRVTDFGIARCLNADSRLTRAGETIGTPSYMSPEQAQGRGDQVGPATDVYSLGATLYCLLTGRPPFQAATAREAMNQVIDREPVSPRRLNPAVGRDLETICLKCLEKRPERRYASATALADDLQRFLEHRPIQARPVPLSEKAFRWCRRNPLAAASLAGIAAVFLTAFVLVTRSYWRAERALRQEAHEHEAAVAARDDARRHERAERWERYRANLTAAASAFPAQNLAAARRAIAAAPAEHRNWEWRHYQHLLDQSRQVLHDPGIPLNQVFFAGKGRLLTVGGPLRLWDRASGRVTRTFPDFLSHEYPVLALSPDGRWLAYPAGDNTVILWDVPGDRRQAVLGGGDGPIASLRFSADSLRIVACSREPRAYVWDTATGQLVRSWPVREEHAGRVGFNLADRALLVSGFPDGTARLWDTRTGRKRVVLAGHQATLIAAAFHPRGDRIVTSESYPSNAIRLWDAESGRQLAVLSGHTNQVHGLVFSPDGGRIASCSFDQTVRLWEGKTGAPVATLRGHAGRVLAVAFSPDGKRLASVSQDHTLRLWDGVTGEPVALLCGHTSDVNDVAFSPDGAWIASGSSDGTARLWDVRLAERNGILRGHTSFVYAVAFHPDGERVASAAWDGTVRLWDATSGRETVRLNYPEETIVSSVAIHPRGQLLATLGRDDAVRLWDVASGRQLHHWTIPTNHWRDGRLAFGPRGGLLAAGAKDGTVHLWDVESRSEAAVFRGHREMVQDVVFGPRGDWLASAGTEGDNTIRIWDVARREGIAVLGRHAGGVYALAVNREGTLLASGSVDGTVRLWSTATWEEVAVLKHGTNVYGLAFSPDGTRLATACADNTVRFWDVATRQEVAELRGHGAYVHDLAFSPDGTRLATASGDYTLRIWDTLSGRQRAGDNKPGDDR